MFRSKIAFAVALFVLSFVGTVSAQVIDPPEIEWEKIFGGVSIDEGKSTQQTSDGGYIVAGSTYSFGAGLSDAYLIKTDSVGNLVWEKTFGGENYDWGYSVQQTTDGGYIVAGATRSFGAGVYLVKTDAFGNLVWEKTFSGSAGYSVQQTSDGGYIITGETNSSSGWSDVCLIKTDASGNLTWQKTFGDEDYWWNDTGYSVQQTSDGGYIITGETKSYPATMTNPIAVSDIYLLKTDSVGNLVWENSFGRELRDEGYSVQQTSDGGYIITGYRKCMGARDYDWGSYLLKTDAMGNMVWQKTFGEDYGIGIGYSVQQTSDGGYIVAGPGSCLVKTDAQGNVVWQKKFGGELTDCAYSVQQTIDGGYIVAGTTRSFGAGDDDMYLIKFKPDPPLPPQDVTAQLRSTQNAKVEWKNTAADVEKFIIEKKSASVQSGGGAAVGDIDWQFLAETDSHKNTFIDTVLYPSTVVSYRVSAVNANGRSVPSTPAVITTPDNFRVQLKIYDPAQNKWVGLKQSDGQFNPDYGTAVFIHGLNIWGGEDINDYGFQKVAKAILERYNQINVIAWDWMLEGDGGFLVVSDVLRNMRTQIHKFRNAFSNLIPDGYQKSIQLFGHSLGCYFVATCVENELWAPNPRASKTFPDQITLWDPADIATFAPDDYTRDLYINRLTKQITSARQFNVYVDCYSGITNWTTHNSSIWINVPNGYNLIPGHDVDLWYAATADIDKAPLLYTSEHCLFSETLDGEIGFGASILIAPQNDPYRHRVKVAQCRSMGTLKFSKLTLCWLATGYDIFGLDPRQDCSAPLALAEHPIPGLANTNLKIASALEGRGGDVEQSATIRLPLLVYEAWDYISFEFDFVSAPEPALLRVSIENETRTGLLTEIDSDAVFNDEYLSTGILSIERFQGEQVSLVFTLSSTSEGAEVRLNNLKTWTSAYDRNEPPIAVAGDDQTFVLQTENTVTIQLDGSNSSDNENDELYYSWYTQGELLAGGINPSIDLTPGRYLIELVVTDSVDHTASDTLTVTILIPFLRGDSNGDNAIDISDSINILGYLFLGTGNVKCKDSADTNDDGGIDISDAVYVLSFLFSGGNPIPEPYPNMGLDETDDILDCREYNR